MDVGLAVAKKVRLMAGTPPGNARNSHKKWDEWDKRMLVTYLNEGKSYKDIAKELQRTEGAIKSRVSSLRAFQSTCGECIVEHEALNTTALLQLARVFGAEANKRAAEGNGTLPIIHQQDIPVGLHYKVLIDEKYNTYVEFKGCVPLDPKSPKFRNAKIELLVK